MQDFQRDFIRFVLDRGALLFGEFRTRSGRRSPYFYDSGRFHDGASLLQLGRHYAAAIRHHKLRFDVLYGPAYKGIPLVMACAIALNETGAAAVHWCFNRKEEKGHGEGGNTVGAPLAGRVLIIDDVITSGQSVREARRIIAAAGAEPAAVLIALDREERGENGQSAADEVQEYCAAPVLPIVTLSDIVECLAAMPAMKEQLASIRRYQEQWCHASP